MASDYSYADQENSTPKWAWLLATLVALCFLYWAIESCYTESVECRGQGCLIVWIETLFVYGLAYLLLVPAYLWMAAGRPSWVGMLAFGGLLVSAGLLYFHTSHFTEGAARWDNISIWHRREEAYIPYRLLLSIGITSILLLLRAALRRWTGR